MGALYFTNTETISEALNRQDYEYVLAVVGQHVSSIKFSPDYMGSHVYMPELDEFIQLAGEGLSNHLNIDAEMISTRNERTLVVIATELYNFGGHTKVVQDMIRDFDGEVIIVLTDIYGNYASGQLNFIDIQDQFEKNASVIALPSVSLRKKVEYLINLQKTINPVSTIIAAHHDDVIAYAAMNKKVGGNQIFLHHADHNPALGATVMHYSHVDLTANLVSKCSDHLKKETLYLPLYVKDKGMKRFTAVDGPFSTVTSGSTVKFFGHALDIYCQFVEHVLREISGFHYHIGPIPEDKLEQIKAYLAARSISPERFRHIPWVPSLWLALQELDAHVYFASFPVAGARAAVEALGCGFPIIAWSGGFNNDKPFLDQALFYPPETQSWIELPDLKGILASYRLNHGALSTASRHFFLNRYSEERFKACLTSVLNRSSN